MTGLQTRVTTRRSTTGFTLVEIMVAMVISLVILGGAITIMLQNQKNYRQNDDFGRLQENARFALDLITTDLRMAGFMGCVRNNRTGALAEMNKVTSKLANIISGDLLDPLFPLDGWEDTQYGTWAAQLSDELNGTILPGTDAITIRRLRNRGVPITQNMAAADDSIIVMNIPVNNGEIAAIYNCDATDIFQAFVATAGTITTITHGAGLGDPGNIGNALSMAYDQNKAYTDAPEANLSGSRAKTFVSGFDAVRYYIANDNGQPALWRQFHNGVAIVEQALVEGIENMQIFYGVDTDLQGDPDSYVTADAVGNWNQVVAVRVNLLVSTINEYGSELDRDTNLYDIMGTAGDTADDLGPFNDRRSRKLVSATVLLRNMQPRVGES